MTNIETKTKTKKPRTAKVLFVIGWIIIVVAFFTGCHFKFRFDPSGVFAQFYAWFCWIGGTTFGTLLIGVGKIIELLTIIANKDYLIKETVNYSQINTSELSSDQ